MFAQKIIQMCAWIKIFAFAELLMRVVRKTLHNILFTYPNAYNEEYASQVL